MAKLILLIIIILMSTITVNCSVYSVVSKKIGSMAKGFNKRVIREIIDVWYHNNPQTIKVMMIGKSGVGKSTLINSLFQKEICQTGDYKATTKRISINKIKINNVNVHIYDTPGLFDDEGNDNMYFNQIQSHINKIDIIMLCYDVTDKRFRKEDVDLLQILTKSFGKTFWNRAKIVLTFANEASFKKVKHREEAIAKHIAKIAGMSANVLLAGYKKPFINFPGCEPFNWFGVMWNAIIKSIPDEKHASIAKLSFDSLYDEVQKNRQLAETIKTELHHNKNIPKSLLQQIIDHFGCLSGDTLIKSCNGGYIAAKNVGAGTMIFGQNGCTKVLYVKKHYGLYYVHRINSNVYITGDHLVKKYNMYIKARDKYKNVRIAKNVYFIWTKDEHIKTLGNEVLSCYSNYHWIKSLFSRPIRFILDLMIN